MGISELKVSCTSTYSYYVRCTCSFLKNADLVHYIDFITHKRATTCSLENTAIDIPGFSFRPVV